LRNAALAAQALALYLLTAFALKPLGDTGIVGELCLSGDRARGCAARVDKACHGGVQVLGNSLQGSCPTAWCRIAGAATSISGYAGLIRLPCLAA